MQKEMYKIKDDSAKIIIKETTEHIMIKQTL